MVAIAAVFACLTAHASVTVYDGVEDASAGAEISPYEQFSSEQGSSIQGRLTHNGRDLLAPAATDYQVMADAESNFSVPVAAISAQQRGGTAAAPDARQSSAARVPEPGTFILVGLGLVLLAAAIARRRRAAHIGR